MIVGTASGAEVDQTRSEMSGKGGQAAIVALFRVRMGALGVP